MLMKYGQVLIIFLGTIVIGRMCIAGTWIDDFSDRSLEDWGGTWDLKNDKHSAGVNKGRFNFRGKSEIANLSLRNSKIGEIHDFTLEIKFMFRRIEVPEKTGWGISCGPEGNGRFRFMFSYSLGALVIPNTAFVAVSRPVNRREFREFRALARARFEYEEEKWYTLKIDVRENRYIFWIENLGLEIVDDLIPPGWIELHFFGMCNIWLDDFTVTAPTVPDGGPGFPRAVLPAEKLTITWGKLKVRD